MATVTTDGGEQRGLSGDGVPIPPRVGTLLWRGATKRCPACGQGRLFHRWVVMAETCPRCGLRFERIEGHWIGAIGINTIVSFGALLLAVTIGLVATFPDFPVGRLIAVNVLVAVVVPLVNQPFSRTTWTAIDIAMRPLEPHEVDWHHAGDQRRRSA